MKQLQTAVGREQKLRAIADCGVSAAVGGPNVAVAIDSAPGMRVRPLVNALTPDSMPSNRYDAESPPPQLVAEIRQRLAKICDGWPAELFESMTARAAWIEFKYERAMVDGFMPITFRDDRAAGRRSKAG